MVHGFERRGDQAAAPTQKAHAGRNSPPPKKKPRQCHPTVQLELSTYWNCSLTASTTTILRHLKQAGGNHRTRDRHWRAGCHPASDQVAQLPPSPRPGTSHCATRNNRMKLQCSCFAAALYATNMQLQRNYCAVATTSQLQLLPCSSGSNGAATINATIIMQFLCSHHTDTMQLICSRR